MWISNKDNGDRFVSLFHSISPWTMLNVWWLTYIMLSQRNVEQASLPRDILVLLLPWPFYTTFAVWFRKSGDNRLAWKTSICLSNLILHWAFWVLEFNLGHISSSWKSSFFSGPISPALQSCSKKQLERSLHIRKVLPAREDPLPISLTHSEMTCSQKDPASISQWGIYTDFAGCFVQRCSEWQRHWTIPEDCINSYSGLVLQSLAFHSGTSDGESQIPSGFTHRGGDWGISQNSCRGARQGRKLLECECQLLADLAKAFRVCQTQSGSFHRTWKDEFGSKGAH